MIKNLKKDFFMPDFSFENEFDFDVAGVDEAGRGPWAGPVVAGAVVIKNRCLAEDLKAELDDSKKLTAAKREKLYARLLEEQAAGRLLIGIGEASCREIDELNILQATFLAMRRAVERLPVCPRAALVDGNRTPKPFPCACKTVVKGDSRSFSIAAASVVAKVYIYQWFCHFLKSVFSGLKFFFQILYFFFVFIIFTCIIYNIIYIV